MPDRPLADSTADDVAGEVAPRPDLRPSPARFLPYVLLLPAAILSLAIYLDWWPILRGGFGWRWPYAAPTLDTWQRLLPAMVVLIAYAFALVLLRRGPGWLWGGVCLVAAVAVPVALLAALDDPFFLLYIRTVSPEITGPHTAGTTVTSLLTAIRAWPQIMPTWTQRSVHVAIGPAGWPVLYYAAAAALARFPTAAALGAQVLRSWSCDNYQLMALSNAQLASAWLGIASPLWSALTVLPLHWLARQVGGVKVARGATAWWPVVPALAMFIASPNTVYPALAVLIVALAWWGTGMGVAPEWKRVAALSLAGVLSAAATAFNFSLLPLWLLVAFVILIRTGWQRDSPPPARLRAAVEAGLPFAAGLLAANGVYALVAGYSPLLPLGIAMRQHLQLDRPYLPWLWLHLWDVILFMGLPAFMLAALGAARTRDAGTRRLALALAATFAIMLFSGTARGETGRVWIFLMPFVLVLTGAGWDGLSRVPRLLFALAQAAWLLLTLAVLMIPDPAIHRPPSYADVAGPAMAGSVRPTNATFGEELRLVGYQAGYHPQTRRVALAFHWQPLRAIETPYYFSAVLVQPDGTALPGQVWQPFATRYPTTCWRPGAAPGSIVVDQAEFALPAGAPEGDWWLSLTVFPLQQGRAGRPLPVRLEGGQLDTQLGLGPLRVDRPQP